MVRRLPFLFRIGVLLLVLHALPASADTVPLEQARAQIRQYQSDLQAMRAELDSKYSYEKAAGTLEQLFTDSDVEYARQYLKDWGGWLYVTWDNVELYRIHDEHLQASLRVVDEQGFATSDQMAYLEDAMSAFRAEHEALAASMEAYTSMIVERGLMVDQIEAVSAEYPEVVERELKPELASIEGIAEDIKNGSIVPYRTREVFSAIGGECYAVSPEEEGETSAEGDAEEARECGELEQELSDPPPVNEFMESLEQQYYDAVWEETAGAD